MVRRAEHLVRFTAGAGPLLSVRLTWPISPEASTRPRKPLTCLLTLPEDLAKPIKGGKPVRQQNTKSGGLCAKTGSEWARTGPLFCADVNAETISRGGDGADTRNRAVWWPATHTEMTETTLSNLDTTTVILVGLLAIYLFGKLPVIVNAKPTRA